MGDILRRARERSIDPIHVLGTGGSTIRDRLLQPPIRLMNGTIRSTNGCLW